MQKTNHLTMHRITLTIILIVFSISSVFAQEYRNFTGSNGKIIEAAFLGFDEATQIVKLRLKDGREQNVKLDLFSVESQQWIKNPPQTDDPFGDGTGSPASSDQPIPTLTPGNREREITQSFVKALNERHVSSKTFNREMGTEALEKYTDALDPQKIYFLQSDIDGFQRRASEMATNGNVSLGFDVYNRYLERINEAIDIALKILERPIDFNVDEEYILDRSKLTFPKDAGELADRWRKKIKYEILQLKSGDDKNDPVERIKKRYANLRKLVPQNTNDDALELFLTSIGKTFDTRTRYASPITSRSTQAAITRNLVGIGATLASEDDGIVTVTGLVSGGPAARSGQINVGDKIISVGQGRGGVMEDITGMKVVNAVEKIRGQEGTTVRLEILEVSGNKKTIEIRRDRIETGSKVTSEVFTVGRNKAGQPCKIGVINIPDFMQGRANEVREIIRDMRNKNVDAIILDLSFNGGGLLPEAIQTIGFFIETGPIIQRQGRGGSDKQITNTSDPANEWKGALVVLTSKLTLSAGEIAAAALQDFGRALIVGNSRTGGYGLVQTVSGIGRTGLGGNVADAEYGSTSLAIQSLYRVSGKSLQGGIVPDVILPSMLELSGSSEKNDSIESIAPVFQYPNFAFVAPQMIETLKRNSDARIRSNNQFREVQRHIRQHTEKESVSLNERKYLAMMRDASNTSKAKLLTEAQSHNAKIVRDFYLDEVLAITSEYVNLIP